MLLYKFDNRLTYNSRKCNMHLARQANVSSSIILEACVEQYFNYNNDYSIYLYFISTRDSDHHIGIENIIGKIS